MHNITTPPCAGQRGLYLASALITYVPGATHPCAGTPAADDGKAASPRPHSAYSCKQSAAQTHARLPPARAQRPGQCVPKLAFQPTSSATSRPEPAPHTCFHSTRSTQRPAAASPPCPARHGAPPAPGPGHLTHTHTCEAATLQPPIARMHGGGGVTSCRRCPRQSRCCRRRSRRPPAPETRRAAARRTGCAAAATAQSRRGCPARGRRGTRRGG